MDKYNIRTIFWYHHTIAQRLLHRGYTPPLKWLSEFAGSFWKGDTPNQNDDRGFFHFYLTSTKDFCIRFLAFNALFLLGSVYIIAQNRMDSGHTELDPTFSSFRPAIVEISIWIVLSLLCLGYFLVLHYRPSLFKDFLMSDAHNTWTEIAAAVLCSRFLIFVVQLTTMLNSRDTCYDSPDLVGTGDTTFGYMFIKMTVDAYQTFAFAALPFPQPWAVAFVLMELIKQETRLFSCADRITTDPQLRWIIYLVAYLLVAAYVVQIIITSLFLEQSYRNRYRSIQMQCQAEESKQEMVTFLCTDVRVPLQYMLHALDSIDWIALSGSDVHPLLADIHKYSHVVNDIADDLLLLVRIKENRYTSKQVLVPNLQQLFDNIVQSVLERRKRHASQGDAELHSQQCFVYASAPAVAATVNQECLVAALRHLLIFITHHQQESETLDGRESPVEANVEVEITVKLSGPAERQQRLTVMITGNSLNRKDWSEARRVTEATTSYVCHAIAVSCGGAFTGSESTYEMILPCAQLSPLVDEDGEAELSAPEAVEPPALVMPMSVHHSDNDAESAVNSVATNLRSVDTINRRVSPMTLRTDNLELETKIKLSADMQARFKKNRVCVIIEDTVLEDVITGAIKRMHLDEGMAVLHELQNGSTPIAKLTFVTSFKLCQELRARRYQGLIVLFSGSLSYLDDTQLSKLDYCLQLPCTDLHLSAFIDWLVSVYKEENKQTSAAPSSTPAPRLSRAPPSQVSSASRAALHQRRTARVSEPPMGSMAANLQKWDAAAAEAMKIGPVPLIFVFYRLVRGIHITWKSEWTRGTWFLVPALPQGTFESYMKWKLLNPAGSWYHHSAEMALSGGVRLAMALFLETLVFKQSLTSVIPGAVVCCLMLFRGGVYKWILQKRSIPLYAYWLIPATVLSSYYLISFLAGGFGQISDDRNLTLSVYADHVFADGRTGAQYLYGQIMTVTHARTYSIYFAQPLNLSVLILILLRATQAVWQVLRTFCSVQVCAFLQLLYVQMTVLNVQYVIHLETSYRNEFMLAHQHILDKAFLDQCLDICQQDIRKPLELLLARQDDLVKVIMHSAISRSVHLTRTLVSKLEPLHVSTLLFTEMVSAFAYHYQAELNDDVALPRSPVELVQLNRVVAKIIAGFSSYAENFHIKIYSEIDNKLAVIRVDWRMLSMILTNLINTALKNVRDYCIETPRNKDLMNHILLKFTAIDSDAKLPFVHPRLMLINVCDSSNMAAKLVVKSTASMVLNDAPSVTRHNGDATSAADLAEQSDRISSKYGNTVCEKLVRKVSLKPLFETVATDTQFQTVQRFTFNYHLTPQTRKAQEFIDAEANKDFLTVRVTPGVHLSAYERVLQPRVRARTGRNGQQQRMPSAKHMVYLSGVEPEQRKETILLAKRLEAHGWNCAVKYIIKVPNMQSIGNADCVLIDQQLELSHNVNISDTVLKLRVCGFNGLIVVLLQEGARLTDVIKEELSRSAADIDILLYAPLKDQNIQSLSIALEKKYTKQVMYMNGN